jgi:hypothetical protein
MVKSGDFQNKVGRSVTQVFRRKGTAWEFVHRHADPLLKNLSLEQAAALSRQ